MEQVSEYIEREKAVVSIMATIFGDESEEVLNALQEATDNINALPAADVAPVVCGHWKNVKGVLSTKWGECSNCDRANEITRYCPYCGAKMDGEKRE